MKSDLFKFHASRPIFSKTVLSGIITSLLFLVSSITFNYAYAAEVKVGGYIFPPFVDKVNGKISGITLDLISAMNGAQSKYHFKFFLTSSKRRYEDFDNGHFSMMLFEDKQWGWKNKDVESSNVFLTGGEVYISLKEKAKSQAYFSDFNSKTMVGIRGFHYGFAGFKSDAQFLKQNFNMQLTSSHPGSIQMILSNRGDIAVITKSYLALYTKNNPGIKGKIMVSDKMDQPYNHTILLKKNASPNVGEVNSMIKQLKDSGKLASILKKYGI